MTMDNFAILRIHGRGNVNVAVLRKYFTDLEHAYNSYISFEMFIEGQVKHIEGRRKDEYVSNLFPVRFTFPISSKRIASVVPLSNRLVLKAAILNSPGFWEFLGNLNPLEVLRNYLSDRHERRKDKEYRESEDARRRRLENLLLENKVIKQRLELLKEYGGTESDKKLLINQLIYEPIRALDRYQDEKIIGDAEILRLEHSKPDDPNNGS